MSNDYEREEVVAKLVAIIDESVKKLRRDGTTKEKLVEMLHDTDSGLFSLLETMKDDIKKYKIEQGTIEEFIFERYFGFTKLSDNSTQEYQIHHPKWMTHEILNTHIDCDFRSMYGEAFAGLENQTPDSIIIAEGSLVSVNWKREQF